MSHTHSKPATPLPESLVGRTLRNGEYFVKRIIGHGGMGKVYLVSHSSLNIPLALKQAQADEPLPESVIAELDHVLYTSGTLHRPVQIEQQEFPSSGGIHTDHFLREALFLARLQHLAISSLYDYFFEDGYWYLVMDYVPGPTLAAYMRQYAPLPPLEALHYAMQLCDVLDYLHKQSPPIIFRDLKPSNIILMPEGTLMLVDFGIARYFKEGQDNDTTDFGSPGYASPEQYQGEGQTDARSDLFSLGVILHEMLSGQRPTAIGGMRDNVHERVRLSNPDVSVPLSALVALATRLEPAYRFQSARGFYLALHRVYQLEERRLYQQQVAMTQNTEDATEDIQEEQILTQPMQTNAAMDGSSAVQAQETSVSTAKRNEKEQTTARPVLTMEQRYKTRESLQQARVERVEQERLELHLASVDESLKIRTAAPLAAIPQIPQPFAEEPEEVFLPARGVTPSLPRIPRLLQRAFLVALLLFVVLSSLLLYARIAHHSNSLVKSSRITATEPATRSSQLTTPGSDSWQILPSLPAPQADNTLAYVQINGQAYLYMTGGYRGVKRTPHYDHALYRYSIATAQWQVITKDGFPGMVNNAVAEDERGDLFYTVGYSTDSYAVVSQLYLYQPTTNMLRKIMPPAQITIGFGASMLADQQGHLYVTQGFLKSGDTHAQAGTGWYRYDIASGQWQQLAPLPHGLGYVVLAQNGAGNIVLLAGASDAGQHQQSDALYSYNVTENSWTQAASAAPVPLSGVASCSVQNGHLVVIGGYDSQHNVGQSHAWLVDLMTLQWTALPTLPSGGSVLGAAACDAQGHVFLVRGASDPSNPTLDFWELTVHA